MKPIKVKSAIDSKARRQITNPSAYSTLANSIGEMKNITEGISVN